MSAYEPDPDAREVLPRVLPWRPGEFRVTWRRQGWVHSASRKYEYEHAARAFMDKLLNVDPRWEPVVEVKVHVRPVGPWETVVTWTDDQ